MEMLTGRKTCTSKRPMPKGDTGRWAHKESREVPGSQEDGYPAGDTVKMKCPACSHTWIMELPQ